MNGDLISRSALLEALKKSREYHAESGRDLSLLCRCENIVKAQPTSYNVDKVVEQIMNKHCGNCRNYIAKGLLDKDYCGSAKCEIHAICEIVKAGGVE